MTDSKTGAESIHSETGTCFARSKKVFKDNKKPTQRSSCWPKLGQVEHQKEQGEYWNKKQNKTNGNGLYTCSVLWKLVIKHSNCPFSRNYITVNEECQVINIEGIIDLEITIYYNLLWNNWLGPGSLMDAKTIRQKVHWELDIHMEPKQLHRVLVGLKVRW